MEDKQKRRSIRCMKVENREFQVLVDTGATVNVLDECTSQQSLADKVTLKASSGVLCAFQTEESPTAPLKVIGKFCAMVKSGKRMALSTFHVIKSAQTLNR